MRVLENTPRIIFSRGSPNHNREGCDYFMFSFSIFWIPAFAMEFALCVRCHGRLLSLLLLFCISDGEKHRLFVL